MVRRILKFDNCFNVDSAGRSGGLAMFWNNQYHLQLYSCTRWHISMLLDDQLRGWKWMITSFYGHSDASKRKISWSLLRSINREAEMLWICSGDFNEITCYSEKFGGCPRPYKLMQDFQEALNQCDLYELPTIGSSFTRANNRYSHNFTKEKLDLALAN